MEFLNDTDPRKWDRNLLASSARTVVGSERPVDAKEWFAAAYALALALLMVGEASRAADLMEVCIRAANGLAEDDPDAIELGVEAWLNRVELERSMVGNEAVVDALEAAYALMTGAPIAVSHLFGLSITHISSASAAVRARSLNAARNRVQSTLLKQLLKTGDEQRALDFAKRVIRDFPGAVRHGMLEPLEVVAMLAPRHSMLDEYAPLQPTTEGDFVIHLRTCNSSGPAAGAVGSPSCDPSCDFDRHLTAFEAAHAFRNPCTPWLWRVHHDMTTTDEDTQRSRASSALRVAARYRDLRTHQRILALASHRTKVEPTDAVFVEGPQPTGSDLVDLFRQLLAVAPTPYVRTTALVAQERVPNQPCHL